MAERKRHDRVVVITGASSGIGRATAIAFAEQGAAVVLAARREAALHQVAEDVHRAGGRAMVIATDVRDEGQVQTLARRATDAFDRIDIWINNAGIGAFGSFADIPGEAFKAVIDTTFYGSVHGFRAALPQMKRQGYGIIITTASVAGRIPTPYQAPYNAAKHALLGFVETVRQELDLDGEGDIHVCSVLPGPVDTPFWQHSANYSGRDVQALPNPSAPEDVAAAMLRLADHPKREVGVGAPPWLLEIGMGLAGGTLERRMARSTRRHLFQERFHGRTDGALLRPMPEGTGTSGGWRPQKNGDGGRHSGIGIGSILALAVPIGAAALYRYQRHGKLF
ncbi:SDR family oxidoreductase [Oleisolibacter albus]|uniref:SDR family oxidoreductase n=1 Tax=Oleisolibacter albus TaxID=2171757 RepID=UPI000DF258B0|nr:SDR family oxidoreductase [Oleisolibacter albus]